MGQIMFDLTGFRLSTSKCLVELKKQYEEGLLNIVKRLTTAIKTASGKVNALNADNRLGDKSCREIW